MSIPIVLFVLFAGYPEVRGPQETDYPRVVAKWRVISDEGKYPAQKILRHYSFPRAAAGLRAAARRTGSHHARKAIARKSMATADKVAASLGSVLTSMLVM